MARGLGRHDPQDDRDEYDTPDVRRGGSRPAGRGQYDGYDDQRDSQYSGRMPRSGQWREHEYDDGYSRQGSALVPADRRDAARYDETGRYATGYHGYNSAPFIIPGSGSVSRGGELIPRRERPLVMRLAVLALTACVVLTGLFAVSPLAGSGADAHGGSPFTSLAQAVVWHAAPDFIWYTARAGDTLDTLKDKFKVQVGGIYELNGMLSGEELQIGKAYKIPTDPNYGLYFKPESFVITGYGTTTYGDSPWTSLAGVPPEGASCGPNGDGNPMAYQLGVPNPNAYWVRGFSWYHNGADLANPEGTPIHAAQAGEVIFSGWDVGGGGWAVKINHCNHVSTFYAHMDTLLVSVHQMVKQGDVVGLEGSTGWSTGPHLHFTVEWDNNPVDPLAYYCWNTDVITGHAPPAC
jgi:murein DD-endopeptidase MepM/ murein hydrolase activator NlpD